MTVEGPQWSSPADCAEESDSGERACGDEPGGGRRAPAVTGGVVGAAQPPIYAGHRLGQRLQLRAQRLLLRCEVLRVRTGTVITLVFLGRKMKGEEKNGVPSSFEHHYCIRKPSQKAHDPQGCSHLKINFNMWRIRTLSLHMSQKSIGPWASGKRPHQHVGAKASIPIGRPCC